MVGEFDFRLIEAKAAYESSSTVFALLLSDAFVEWIKLFTYLGF